MSTFVEEQREGQLVPPGIMSTFVEEQREGQLVPPGSMSTILEVFTEPEFLNFEGTRELIPPAYAAWRAGTSTLFLLGFLAPIHCSKIPAQGYS